MQGNIEKNIDIYDDNPSVLSAINMLRRGSGFKRISIPIKTGGRVEQDLQLIPKKKDIRKQIKFFEDTDSFNRFIALGKQAQIVIGYIISKIETHTDYTYIYGNDFVVKTGLSRATLSLGVKELVEKGWLFMSTDPKKYWININLISKGDLEGIYYKRITMGLKV